MYRERRRPFGSDHLQPPRRALRPTNGPTSSSLDHAVGAAEIEELFGVTADLLRDGESRTRETLTIGTHNANHVDYSPDYIRRGPGVTAKATHWPYDHGVRVMGIDAWGWDRPLHLQAEDAPRELLAGPPGGARLRPDRAPRRAAIPADDGLDDLLPSLSHSWAHLLPP